MMRHFFLGVVLGASFIPGAALSDPTPPAAAAAPSTPKAMQPPMNNFDFAFYDCDGADVQIMYDGDAPTRATLVTSASQKYVLTRVATSSGVQFAKGPVKFWTDRRSVLIQGTAIPIRNCRLKGR